VINLGSYNYLGFSSCEGKCTDDVETCAKKYGLGTCGSLQELGTYSCQNINILYHNFVVQSCQIFYIIFCYYVFVRMHRMESIFFRF
jgi:hypothetical protein